MNEILQINDLSKLNSFLLKYRIDNSIYSNLGLEHEYLAKNMIVEKIKKDNIIEINIFFPLYELFSNNSNNHFILTNKYKLLLELNIKKIFLVENIIFFNSISGLFFNKCIFNENLIFHDLKIKEDVKFENCIFEKDLIFENCEFNKDITFKNCKIKNKLDIIRPKGLKYLNINECSNIKEVHFKFFDTINDSGYFIYNSIIKKIKIENSTNISDKFIIGGNKIGLLEIIDTNLGKTIFNGVKIDKLYLENATLNDCVFNGVDFPKNYELEKKYKNEKGKEKLSNKQLKDNYRQLKYIMDKNGNLIDGNRFFEKEMSYLIFSWDGFLKLPEKILGFFQLIISQFGNNWFLPLLWIILFGFVTTKLDGYFLISDFTNTFPFIDIKFDNYNQTSINLFFTNINPFDKSLFTKDGITYGNFIHKIILIILYWHLLVAIKRTTKR